MRASAALGVAAVAFGFVVVVQRGLAGLFDLTYVFVTGAGVLALVQGLRYANEARTAEHRATETGDPEDRYEVPVPGDADDELIARRGFSRASVKRRREFHRRLRRVAEETLRARGDYADGDVADAVDDGAWTDDPVAAWFLGTDVPAPRAARLRRLLGSDAEFRFGVARTVDALAAVRSGAGVEASGAEDEAGPDRPRTAAERVVATARRAGQRRIASARDAFAEVRR
ncbi:DUF7269 family protein [Halobaculum gomorrense]|uniref:Uncharacterized protein n=1 Tax=Halobaculum gomorrense TaxID=43928 RepID=A0A1M5JN07_9EURY|nr:hypothetical protein [Halobaculum gomorrense]SHG41775.1 hypothetical protein SAMN05443636_0182 [Halobaculum gomorrense]